MNHLIELKVVHLTKTLFPLIFAVFLFSWIQGEPSFHLFGFIICVAATAARALKSVLQGILLSSEG
jgi:hypothetical protein